MQTSTKSITTVPSVKQDIDILREFSSGFTKKKAFQRVEIWCKLHKKDEISTAPPPREEIISSDEPF